MTYEIRHPRADEYAGFIDAMSTAFLDRPDVAQVAAEVQALWELDRMWMGDDAGRIVATYRSWGTELTVPGGGRLPAAAVTNVAVLPTHRRRGLLSGMMAADHAAMRERGEVFGLLYAAEYPIYGRFGYGPGCLTATWTLDTRRTAFHGAADGSVELALPNAATADILRSVYDRARALRAGQIRRRDYRWEFDLALRPTAWGEKWKGFVAIHRDEAGVTDGYVRYHGEEKWEQNQPRSTITVDDLQALTDRASDALWRYLASVDLVASVKAEGRSPGERLPWLLTNARAARVSDVGDGMWVRIVDVSRALEARTYEHPANLVLELVDAAAPGARQRYAIDAGADGARCVVTDRGADLTIDTASLGAAYLGGVRLRDAVLSTGADEHRAGALATADALFATRDAPWCSTFF